MSAHIEYSSDYSTLKNALFPSLTRTHLSRKRPWLPPLCLMGLIVPPLSSLQRATSPAPSPRPRSISLPSRSWSWSTSWSCRTRSTWWRRARPRSSTSRFWPLFRVSGTIPHAGLWPQGLKPRGSSFRRRGAVSFLGRLLWSCSTQMLWDRSPHLRNAEKMA